MKFLLHSAYFTAMILLAVSTHAQTPTSIDPGYNDESVNMWSDPMYILIAVIILLAVVLGWLRYTGRKRRR